MYILYIVWNRVKGDAVSTIMMIGTNKSIYILKAMIYYTRHYGLGTHVLWVTVPTPIMLMVCLSDDV